MVVSGWPLHPPAARLNHFLFTAVIHSTLLDEPRGVLLCRLPLPRRGYRHPEGPTGG